uniref:Uncharacterized protein n=1 Tax=Lygus hesperus TaxID=30085 RepID=A0A146KLZ4_LYGHE
MYYSVDRLTHNPLSYIPHGSVWSTSLNNNSEQIMRSPSSMTTNTTATTNNTRESLSNPVTMRSPPSSTSMPSLDSNVIQTYQAESALRQAIALEENRTYYELREEFKN